MTVPAFLSFIFLLCFLRPKDVAVDPKTKGLRERGRGRSGKRDEEEERRRRGRASPREVQEKRRDRGEEAEMSGGGGMKVEARDRSRAAEVGLHDSR